MATPTIQNNYVGDGSTVLYSFTFPYINISDVVVTVDGTAQVIQAEYFFANATTIQFVTAPADGAAILIRRYTASDDVAAVFFPGSAIRARDLNDNFVQSLYVAQESTVTSQDATDSSADAQAAAEAAQAAADSAASDAADALVQANAAGQSASEAQASASDAQALASSAAVSAQEAAASAADASSDAASAIATADGAVVVANAADAKADTAIADSAAAVVTANQSKAESSQAISTADGADAKADTAIGSANSAVVTANNALSAANTAETNSNQAKQDAAAAIEAVSEALLYTLVQNVASIPSSPGDGDAVEVIDSTGIESFTPLTGLPAGFVGNSELFVRILYSGSASSWSFISYNASSPEDRYVTRSGDNMTGDLTIGTNKITLDATDGSAEFAGNVVGLSFRTGGAINDNFSSDGARIRDYDITVRRDGAGADVFKVFKDGASVGNVTAQIFNDGSATFADEITSGLSVPGADGSIQVFNNDSSVQAFKLGNTTLGSNVAMYSDGTITAAGDVKIGGTSASPNITLNANGSSKFAGDVAIGDSTTTFLDKVAVIAALTEEQRETFAAAITAWNNRPEPYDAEDPTTLPADLPLREAIVRVTTAGKINLNANGSITAAGNVQASRVFTTGLSAKMDINYAGNGVDSINAFEVNDITGNKMAVKTDGSITANGSATFAGDVRTAAVISERTNSTDGTFHSKLGGNFTNIVYADGSMRLLEGTGGTGVSDARWLLETSGSMRTRGEINVYASNADFATDGATAQIDPTGQVRIGGTLPASPNIELNADGTITTRNGNEFTRTRSNGTSTDINLRSDKADAATFWQYYNGNDPSDVTYIVRSNGNVEIGGNLSLTQSVSSPNITLNANGTAEFKGGDFTVSGPAGISANLYLTADQGKDNGDGWRIGSNQDDNDLTFANNISGAYVDKLTLLNNGSATFAGNVTANNVTFNLEADDDTKYTSTTDSEGNETRVYNGAVLDVKDRIQNVLARMDAIEANEITDDATDSALLTLIASLSARLDERDAAIAALTARVEELEEA
jgi:hypothetical protein